MTGNRLQKTVIEAGDVYNLTGGAWQEKDIPNGNPFNTPTCVNNEFAYAYSGSTIYERNLSSNIQRTYSIGIPPNSTSSYNIFSYNGGLYVITLSTVNPQGAKVFKVNLSTLTFSLVAGNTYAWSFSYMLTKQVTATKFLFVAMTGIAEFDFATNSFKPLLVEVQNGGNSCMIQKSPSGDFYIGMRESSSSNTKLAVYKYFTASGTLSAITGRITLPSNISTLQAIQLGEKLMYVSDVAYGGKNTGELDLINLTLDTTKYPEAPEGISNQFNLFEYQNQYIYYAASKKYWLPLTQTPPEQNALVMKIFKGQKYSTIHGELHINALAAIGQAAFDITTHQQTAAKDLYIYFGMYQLNSDLKILIEGK